MRSMMFALLLATPVAGQTAVLDSIANSPVMERRVAGLAVAVVKGNDTLLLRGYGNGDLEWPSGMPADAVFEIGSVTKQFTSALVLKLRDEGKLDLDADITTYLPSYPTQGRRIPVRRLLDHTSGIRSYTEMDVFGEIVTRSLPRDSLVVRFAAHPFDFEPGTAAIYNNSAYFLLGLILEKVSGQPYEKLVEEQVFRPLGMTRSSYCTNNRVVARRAHGYSLANGVLERAAYLDHAWPYAAGSLCSTAGDMITWLRALHGGRVLPPSSYRDMITPRPLEDGSPTRYAMGLTTVADLRGRAMISHGGGINGFLSESRYYPQDGLYVVVLVNTTGNLSPAALADELVDAVLPRPTAAVAGRFAGDTTALVGTYSGPARGRPMTVTVRGSADGLVVSVNGGPAAPLVHQDGQRFLLGRQIVSFREIADGRAMRVDIDQGSGYYVLRRAN